jgi:hypothetical protein
MKNITERQLQILEFLAEFKFLTSHQIMGLLGVKTLPHVNLLLNNLSEGKKAFTSYKSFGLYPGHGKLARVHFLKPGGADFLINEIDFDPLKIKLTKERNPLFQRDYFHRVETINFNIEFSKWCKSNNFEKDFFDYYFDKTGSNRNNSNETLTAKNAIPVGSFQIIPDGIGKFKNEDENYIFLFEQHNGKDTKRAVKQILSHAQAIEEGAASLKYNHQKGVKVVYCFEFETCMKATIKDLYHNYDLSSIFDYFLFKTTEQMKEDFNTDWLKLNGQTVNFL